MSTYRRRTPPTVPPEKQVAQIMEQIKQLHPQGIDQPVPVIPEPDKPIEPPRELSPTPPHEPVEHVAPTPAAQGLPPYNGNIHVHDVVQVTNSSSRNYGVTFTVGDMTESKAAGFYILAGVGTQYISEPIDNLTRIGIGVVRSKNPTSPEWRQAHERHNIRR